jgi:hypothetical protein
VAKYDWEESGIVKLYHKVNESKLGEIALSILGLFVPMVICLPFLLFIDWFGHQSHYDYLAKGIEQVGAAYFAFIPLWFSYTLGRGLMSSHFNPEKETLPWTREILLARLKVIGGYACFISAIVWLSNEHLETQKVWNGAILGVGFGILPCWLGTGRPSKPAPYNRYDGY